MALKAHERKVLSFLAHHLLMGVAGGFLFGVLLLWTDVGGIRTMVANSGHTALVVVMLFFGLSVTFGSVAMGIGVMSMGEDQN